MLPTCARLVYWTIGWTISFCAIGQPYRPLLDTTATWQDEYSAYDQGPGYSQYQCSKYYLRGDTTINGLSYLGLRLTGSFHHSNIEPPFNSYTNWYSNELVGWVREDTMERKVYFVRTGAAEQLLYDFSGTMGPYPATYRYWDFEEFSVASVDAVTLNDGEHRRINFSISGSIIEGVGSPDGFMPRQTWAVVFGGGRMVCHTVGSDETFSNISSGCACGSNVSVSEIDRSSPRLTPSITQDLTYIRGAKVGTTFRIIAMNGRTMFEGRTLDLVATPVSLSQLSPGVYVVQLLNDRMLWSLKVVRE